MNIKNILLCIIAFQLIGHTFSQNFTICNTIANQEQPRVVQGLDNWLFSITELVTDIEISDEALNRLQELKAAFDYLGIEVIITNLPTRAMMHYDKFDLEQKLLKDYSLAEAQNAYDSSIETLTNIGFHAPNVLDYLTDNLSEDYGFMRDSHWTPDSAYRTSQLVAEIVNSTSVNEKIQHTDFEIQLKESVQRNSDLARYVMINCDVNIPNEPQEIYEIVVSEDQSELFADSIASIVPLWGTSYSQSSNFSEFLQAELNVEIVNYGFGYAGLWRSLRNYFLELDESEPLPDLAIWEFAYGYFEEFNLIDIYKEIIPTLYGSCEGVLQASDKISHELVDGDDNIFSESSVRFEPAHWNAARSTSSVYPASEIQDTIKLVFNGEKDPFLYQDFETNSTLGSKTYEFSVFLWTDDDQPKNAALYLYSGKDFAVEPVRLTNQPTLYTIKHQFSDNPNTAFTIRIDGIQSQNLAMSLDNKGSYLYASSPSLYNFPVIKLVDNFKEDVYGSNYYTHISFDDLSILDYSLEYRFSDGSIHTEKISRDRHARNNGRYFYELPEGQVSLNSVSLSGVAQSTIDNVSAQICKKP